VMPAKSKAVMGGLSGSGLEGGLATGRFLPVTGTYETGFICNNDRLHAIT
jgi:hypothetical protein